MRTSPALQVEEVSGNQYADLSEAQAIALPILGADLAAIFKRLQAEGLLVTVNGKIIPNLERMQTA